MSDDIDLGNVKHNGSGWYEMPDGNKVRGKENVINKLQGNATGETTLGQGVFERKALSAKISDQFEGDRDIYDSLGYDKNLSFDEYLGKYERQDIAKRIIDLPPKRTWINGFDVMRTDGDEEQEWEEMNELLTEIDFQQKAERVDRLNRLGRYSVMLVGLEGDVDLSKPIDSISNIDAVNYVSPYSERRATIEQFNDDPQSERFGEPSIYELDLAGNLIDADSSLNEANIHHSRIIHVAEDKLENDIFGQPALKPIYNRLDDLQKIVGSSAEGFWREVVSALHIDIDDDATFNEDAIDELDSQVQNFIHGLRRTLQTKNTDVEKITADVADPQNPFDVGITLMAAATGIPKRILLGSERGELSSEQDERNFISNIVARQKNFAAPGIIRPFIDRLKQFNAIDDVEYKIEWPDLFELSESEEADIEQTRADAFQKAEKAAVNGQVATVGELRKALGLQEERPDAEQNRADLDAEDEAIGEFI